MTNAYDQAQASFARDKVNRILMFTDGDFNVGVTDDNDLVFGLSAVTGGFIRPAFEVAPGGGRNLIVGAAAAAGPASRRARTSWISRSRLRAVTMRRPMQAPAAAAAMTSTGTPCGDQAPGALTPMREARGGRCRSSLL